MSRFASRNRIRIGSWPTPAVPLVETGRALGIEVWAKLEEACGAWGGNKVRKLEYILGAATHDGIDRLVGYGTGTSNWTSALARHGAGHGFEVTVALAGPVPEHYSRLYARTGTRVVTLPSELLEVATPVVGRLAAGRRARSLPFGGSGPGDVGSAHAGLEIGDAVAAGTLPRPQLVFAATGTAGTTAGVAAGMGARGLSIPVVAVRVTPRPYGTEARVRRHSHRLIEDLKRLGSALPAALDAPVIGDGRFVAPGYGRPNAASREAIETAAADGLELDGTYAAKAFASLIAHARAGGRGPVLFLHTSPGPPPEG